MIDTRYNANNEVVKYEFFRQLEHCGINGKDPKTEKTVVQYINAIHEYEIATNFQDFKKYIPDSAITFKNHLSEKKSKKTGDHISKSLYVSYTKHVKEFFEWLATENKKYSHITKKDISFFNANKNDKNTALATSHQESHPIEDILATVRKMPESNDIEKRNKAMVSLCLLTTPRIAALQTARIGSIKYFSEYEIWVFDQNPKWVDTKRRSHIVSCFIGQSQDIIKNVLSWLEYLKSKGFKDSDYLFPKIESTFASDGTHLFELTSEKIVSDSWIRAHVFKKAFEANGLKYLKVHPFRHSLARAMKKESNAVELLIALAENDGQKNGMAVIISSYGGDYLAVRSKLMKNFDLEKATEKLT